MNAVSKLLIEMVRIKSAIATREFDTLAAELLAKRLSLCHETSTDTRSASAGGYHQSGNPTKKTCGVEQGNEVHAYHADDTL